MSKPRIPKGKSPVKPRRQVKKAGKRGSVAKKTKGNAAKRASGAKSAVSELKKKLAAERARNRELAKQQRLAKQFLKEVAQAEKARAKKAKAVRKRTEKGLKIKRKRIMTSHNAKADSEGFVPMNYRSPQQKAWESRRFKQFTSQGMSALSALDYSTLNKDQANYLDQIAEDFGDGYLYLPKKERVEYFQRLFQSGSTRLERYLLFVQEMGFTSRQARTALFSPRAIRV